MATGGNHLYVPDALVWQILLCLPVISLLRFKSVCKSWFSWINSPDFAKQHLVMHRGDEDDRLVMDGYVDALRFTLLSDHHHNVCLKLARPGRFASDSNTWFDNFNLIYLDGIVCLYYYDSHYYSSEVPSLALYIYLWNPATRKFRCLPPSHYPPPLLSLDQVHVRSEFAFDVRVGFGFDVKTNGYKLVKFTFTYIKLDVESLIEVYDLCTDSWTPLELQLPVDAVLSNTKEPLNNARYFCWHGLESKSDFSTHLLLWYDFTTHEFETMPFPDSIGHGFQVELTILRGNITSIFSTRNGEVEVWTLKEFGIEQSWIHLCTVKPCLERTVSLFDDGESFLGVWNCRHCIYHSVSQKLTNIRPLEMDLCGGTVLKDVRFKESLVSIEGGSDGTNIRPRITSGSGL